MQHPTEEKCFILLFLSVYFVVVVKNCDSHNLPLFLAYYIQSTLYLLNLILNLSQAFLPPF